ncbi:MAG: peptidoglycan-binding protein [Chloroflexota bacterium]|nr:peptidoglycan-binding protein [Chloroflexota bacterium]
MKRLMESRLIRPTLLILAPALLLIAGLPASAARPGSLPAAKPAADTAITVDVRALAGSGILGAVDSPALAGAQVAVAPLGLVGRSDEQGMVRFAQLAVDTPQPVAVTITLPGYRSWVLRNATLYPHDTLLVEPFLARATTATAAPEVVTVQPPRAANRAAQSAGGTDGPQPLTGGATQTNPPSVIRVYRTGSGAVDVVNFNFYVKHVLPNEWVSGWPAESLRSGAMAAKAYGWYWTIAQKWPGPYDVKDSTADQVYNPNVSYASTNAAVDATWNYKITRNGLIFPAMYCAGAYNGSQTSGQCSALYGWTPGTYMSQNGSRYLADHGYSWQSILNFYYSALTISTWSGPAPTPVPGCTPVTIQEGSSGQTVKTAQYLLRAHGYSLTADGAFGAGTASTVRSFQSAHGLSADGIVGPTTWGALYITVQQGNTGDAVRAVQSRLGIGVDGVFGSGTAGAVRSFQSAHGLDADGIVGPATWCQLTH